MRSNGLFAVVQLCLVFSVLIFGNSFVHAGNTAGTATDAQSGNPNDECDNNGSEEEPSSEGPGCGGANSGAADPIHTLTGNSYQSVNVFQGGGEFPLKFSWHYNSRIRPDNTIAFFRGEWTHTYNDHLLIEAEKVTLVRDDGRKIVFDVSGENLSLTLRNSSTAIFGTLRKEGTNYIYQGRSRLIYTFDASGLLTQVRNKYGLTHEVENNIENGLKTRTITHTLGNVIQLVYANSADILPTEMTDPEGNVYSFTSDITDGIERLKSIKFPDYQQSDDSIVTFQYLENFNLPSANWLHKTALESMIDEEGWRKSTWEYSPEGRAIKNYLGEVNEATDIYDVIAVEAEAGSQQWNAYVTTPYGCVYRYIYHSFRNGQQYPVLPWLNEINGDASNFHLRPNCGAIGNLKTYGKQPGEDWVHGGLEDSGYSNIFSNNIYRSFSGWDPITRKNTIFERYYQADDGVSKGLISRVEYDYHPQLQRAESIRRYEGSNKKLWQEIFYTYFDGSETSIANGRVKSKKIIDQASPRTPDSERYYERTWNYDYEYYDAEYLKLKKMSVVDPRNGISVREYSEDGFLSKTINPAGHEIQFSGHTSRGFPTSVIDINDNQTQYQYSSRGWLLSKTGIEGTTQYEYYKNGLTKKITQPTGTWQFFEYTTARKLKKITYSDGDYMTRSETMDRVNQHVKTVTTEWFDGAAGARERLLIEVFDPLDRLMVSKGDAGVETQYFYEDARFNQKVTKKIRKGGSEQDQITLYSYTASGKLEKSATGHSPSLDQPDVFYEYNHRDNLQKVTDSNGNTTTYFYDGFNQLTEVSSPDTKETLYNYDASGNRILKIDAGLRVAEYQYDSLNRLIGVTYPYSLSDNINFQYDLGIGGSNGLGKLVGVHSVKGSELYSYDNQGRKEAVKRTRDGAQYSWQYSYNQVGQISDLTYPSGRKLKYFRDPLTGMVESVTMTDWAGAPSRSVTNNIQYSMTNGFLGHSSGNSVNTSTLHDQNGRISSISIAGTESIFSAQYQYSTLSNITEITSAASSVETKSFSYDDRDRLLMADYGSKTHQYTYDRNGNRLTEHQTANNQSISKNYSYGDQSGGEAINNRLQTISQDGIDQNFQYDDSGNMVFDPVKNIILEYDETNRLAKVITPSSTVLYDYDYIGQRSEKTILGNPLESRHYFYTDSGALMGEYATDGAFIKEYLYADGRLLGFAAPGSDSDSDSDGLDDDWEQLHFGNLDNEASADYDNDGLSNYQEFIGGRNPTLEESTPVTEILDTDADGLADNWEHIYFGNLSAEPLLDSDGDGISNLKEFQDQTIPIDNRSGGAFNRDEDDDGMLDRWEVLHFQTILRNGTQDFDGDGVSDKQEYLDRTDPTDPYSAGGLNSDADNDGMLDRWEFRIFGTMQRDGTGDYDGDEMSDFDEYTYETDPKDATDFISSAGIYPVLFQLIF